MLHGLIIKNEAYDVTLQERMGEIQIPKKYIRRIEDQGESGVYFADIVDPGKIPPWRMIVQDLRTDDNIASFRQIPATAINSGYLRNIPYLSFRINKHMEMNVYGNPEDPVCLEFGVYEHGSEITRFKKIIRAYLAGTLNSRAEIGALYSLSEKGGEKPAGRLCFKILPPTAPDAYGGWWISVYEPRRLEQARVSDAAYKKVTDTIMSWDKIVPELRGFYRNKKGQLNLLLTPASPAQIPHSGKLP